MIISICIATYDRNPLLEKLLNSIKNQKLDDSIELEVVIVDNSPDGRAAKVISNLPVDENINIKYFLQPIKNISLTRNKAVKESSGEYLAFIDDDEYAEVEWIYNLYNTLLNFKADGVFGRVESYFPRGTSELLQGCFVYEREAPATGSIAISKRTGNCLIKAALIKSLDEPFNLEFGLTGGEDAMLFDNLAAKGAKFVNCYEAVTYEFVPENRTKLSWLISRAIGMGNSFARRMIRLDNNKKIFMALKQLVIGTVYGIVSFCLFILLFFSRKKRLHWFLKMFSNLGKVSASLGIYPKRYS